MLRINRTVLHKKKSLITVEPQVMYTNYIVIKTFIYNDFILGFTTDRLNLLTHRPLCSNNDRNPMFLNQRSH